MHSRPTQLQCLISNDIEYYYLKDWIMLVLDIHTQDIGMGIMSSINVVPQALIICSDA